MLLPTSLLPTSRYDPTPLPPLSLYLPKVPKQAALYDVLGAVGVVDRIDWSSESSAYVHFSTWYDCAVAEHMTMVLSADDASYRLPIAAGGYLICRRNRHPLPPYTGTLSADELAAGIEALQSGQPVIASHIRFGDTGTTHVEYKVAPLTPIAPRYEGPKNIHQLFAEYQWFVKSLTE